MLGCLADCFESSKSIGVVGFFENDTVAQSLLMTVKNGRVFHRIMWDARIFLQERGNDETGYKNKTMAQENGLTSGRCWFCKGGRTSEKISEDYCKGLCDKEGKICLSNKQMFAFV